MNHLIRCSKPTMGLLLACTLALLPACSSRNASSEPDTSVAASALVPKDETGSLADGLYIISSEASTGEAPASGQEEIPDAEGQSSSIPPGTLSAPSEMPSAPPEESGGSSGAPTGADSLQPALGDWALRLVNADNAISETFEPALAMVADPYRMDERVAPVMKQMIADAKAQGIDLLVCSAYRPYSSQKRNFENHMQQNINAGLSSEAARADTMRWIALPGTSEHQTGLSADIVTPAYTALDEGYANTKAAKWLKANAAAYGFILRYPSDKTEITGIAFEPWHYRYVGVEAAQEIMASGVCLEEYLGEA